MYALKLGDFRLAPRASIAIKEPDDFEVISVQSSGHSGGCPQGMVQNQHGVCTPIDKRSLTLELTLQGASHLNSAFNLKRLIDAELDAACTSTKYLRRRVHDEQELIYTISRGWTRIINPYTQFDPLHRNVTIELNLEFSEFRYGNALVGLDCASLIRSGAFPTLDYNVYPASIIVNTTLPTPSVALTKSFSPSPIVVNTSFPSPAYSLTFPLTPITVVVSIPTFTRTVGATPTTVGTSAFTYKPALVKMWNGFVILDVDTRVILVSTNTTADTETDVEFISGFTTLDEFNGAGYARVALTNEAINEDDPNARAEFDADDAAFGAISNGTRQITGAIIYEHVTNDADSIPLFYLPLTPNFSPGGSTVTLNWNAEGIAWHV